MRKLAIALAATLALSDIAIAQNAPQAVGVASAIVREAKLSNARITRPRPLVLRERITLADLIQTGKNSQVQLLLLDRSVFSIGANARLRIDRFVYDPSAGRSMGATVTKGAFRFMSGRAAPQNGSTISTPVATIGIRGTILEGAVGKKAIEIARNEVVRAAAAKADPETATLIVLRGPGAATEGAVHPGAITVEAGGFTVGISQPMLATFVPRAGARPVGPFVISAAGLQMLGDDIFPAFAKRTGSGSALKTLLGVGAVVGAGAVLGNGGSKDSNRQPGTSPNNPSDYNPTHGP